MRESVDVLMQEYQNNLFVIAFNLCKNVQDAEDVVQDTFLQYLSHKKDFETETHLRAWLIRVAINGAKNKTRTLFRRKTVPLEDYMETLTFPTEESSDLFFHVMHLPEKFRLVIHLFYYEEYSVREIAGILHLSEANVKTRLSRGRKLLKQTCKEVWEDDES